MTRPFSERCRRLVPVVLLLAGCSSPPKETTPQQPEPLPPPKAQEVSPQRRSELHTELAAGYYERGQMDVALDELNEAVKLDPRNPKTYNIYGLVYSVLGETQKAEQAFGQARALAPNDSEIRQNWGWYLCTHERQRESIAEFEQAARNPLYKTPEIPLTNAGRCSVMIGDMQLGEAYFRRALAVAPGNEAAAYGLALISYQNGRYQEARQWMKGIRSANLPPQALYLGMCVEKKLGDQQAETSYGVQLRNRFPDSAEAKALGPKACE
jgi:type IV pilus assembly protein PilF